ncbi:uncharacterized protein HKW66_Vig0207040 [Vigna angularis]|uniref:Uncharacterized protein n=1 Tax=Phaseolus angularis TaxID=3914 RepID=A0A8T0JIB7_PHAAN|nr:uncharacterized protein HKW66_Vig0207040 [Vigna angularis]
MKHKCWTFVGENSTRIRCLNLKGPNVQEEGQEHLNLNVASCEEVEDTST